MADVVVRAKGGDLQAVGALYDEHRESIYRFLWSRVGDVQEAEDLTASVFLRMIAALPGYQPRGLPFRAWLFRIARNLLADHYRSRWRRSSVPLEEAERAEAPEGSSPAAAVDRRQAAERVRRLLAGLQDSQRQVMALRFLGGLSIQETAHVLDRTEGAVKSLQHRGLQAMRLALWEEEGELIR